MLYAGIGSRTAPDDILDIMTRVAQKLAALGYKLRSGGAPGSDSAFARGAGNAKEIFGPNDATAEAIELASQFHPAWNRCNGYVRKLHGRNSQIILGRNLIVPVKFVLCYTKNASGKGGTGMGIKISNAYNIPIYDMGSKAILDFILISLEKSSGIFE